jgi:exopolysaccharide biosynthesis polyprenyl glycosylphosphotransferase
MHDGERRSETADGKRATGHESTLAMLVPAPLQRRSAWNWVRCVAADYVLVVANWLLLGALKVPARMAGSPNRLPLREGIWPVLLGIGLLHAALITLMAYTEELQTENLEPSAQTRILAKSVLWATAILCVGCGLQGVPRIACSVFCLAGLLHFTSLWLWRRWIPARPHHPGCNSRNVLIIGAGSVGRRVAAYVNQHPEAGRTVYGFLDDEKPLGNDVLGGIADLARMARKGFVDEVILAAPNNSAVTKHVLTAAQRLHLDVEIVPELFGCEPVRHEIDHVGTLPVICLHAERLPAAGLVLKRGMDLMGAGFALGVLSPLILAIAILIRLDSVGPVLYCAQRVGKKGRLFRCFKFRTMVSNADELKERLRKSNERSGPFFKMKGDPRITPLGRYLRRFSLDELPQLWNVLRGEMSLVGPRPHPVDDVAAYEMEHLARLDVTPGITGLWQVTARRDPSFRHGMELDREYIRKWTLTLDVRILLRTFLEVTCGSGQ